VRIIFLRGSPERIHYSTRDFIVTLVLAIAASAVVQFVLYGDPVTLVILRVFCELTMFMLGVVLLTRKVARFRLARLMLVVVAISLLADVTLVICGLLGLPVVSKMAPYVIGIIAIYGAGNALKWALSRPFWVGLAAVGGYVAVVTVLDNTFRGLYAIMAAG
jgi:arginine exporter protein ArgO